MCSLFFFVPIFSQHVTAEYFPPFFVLIFSYKKTGCEDEWWLYSELRGGRPRRSERRRANTRPNQGNGELLSC